MIRRNIYLTDYQWEFLQSLIKNIKDNISLSEHIRRALDRYIENIKSQNVSASESKRKEDNG